MNVTQYIHIHIYIYIYLYLYLYLYIYMVTPPHDRPRPSKHRSHRRVRAFSGVSSLSPPNVSVKNHPTTETKKPKNQSSTENAGTVLVFWFFGSLVFWFFGFLLYWLFGFVVERVIFQKNPKNQKTKEPKNQKTKTKEPKNQKTKETKNQKTKKPKMFQHSPWSFGFLVFWFRSSGGSSRTRSEGSNSIPRKSRSILILILS